VPTVKDNDTFLAAFGIHPRYFDLLPFIRLGAADLVANGFRPKPPPFAASNSTDRELVVTSNRKFWSAGEFYGVSTSPLMLDPGRYRVTILARSPSGIPHHQTLQLSVNDPAGKNIEKRELPLPPIDGRPYTAIPFDLDVPPGVAACLIELRSTETPDLAIDRIEIHPETVANIIALGKALDAAKP
jgi:hypothetical protein